MYIFCSCCHTREQEQKYCYHGIFNYRARKLTLSSCFPTILLHWNPDGLTISAFINVQDSNCAESTTAFKLKLITESVSESHSGLNQYLCCLLNKLCLTDLFLKWLDVAVLWEKNIICVVFGAKMWHINMSWIFF